MAFKNALAVSLAAAGACVSAFVLSEAAFKNGTLKETPDFLLILGCRVRGDEPEETLVLRAEAAADFLLLHRDTVAVCCGGIVHDDQTKSEAQAISEILQKRGVEKERILLEDKSQTTFENFVNAKKIIDSFTLEKEPSLAFLSSEFHLMRASVIASLAGVKMPCVPADSVKRLRVKNYIREGVVFPLLFWEYLKKGRNNT